MCAFILLKFLELPCTSRIVRIGCINMGRGIDLSKPFPCQCLHLIQVVIIGTKNNISSPVFRIVVEFFRHHILLLPIHCIISSILTNHIHGWHMPRKYLAKTVRFIKCPSQRLEFLLRSVADCPVL